MITRTVLRKGEKTAMRYAVVVPQSRHEVILVSSCPLV